MVEPASLAPWIAGVLLAGGVVALASRRREYLLRWCLWAVAIPTVVALFWWGEPGVALLVAVVAVAASTEYAAMMRLPRPDAVVMGAALLAVIATAWLAPGASWRALGAGVLAIAMVPLLGGDAEHGMTRATRGVLGLVWLCPLAAAVPLGTTALYVVLAVSLADVVAHFAGPAIGGPHLSPLSPAKRWSGAVVGAAAAVALLAALGALAWPTVVAVAIGGPVGDLFESMVKRGAGLKDSGNLMAGAGGLLDRLDSTLMALAVAFLLGAP